MSKTIHLAHKAIRNSTYNFIGYAWSIGLAFFTVPLIIGGLGKIEYGYYIFIGTLLSLLWLIDLGVATAINKFLAEKIGEGDDDAVKRYVGVAKLIFLSFATIGTFILLIASVLSLIIFSGKFSFLAPALLISAFIFFLSTIHSIITVSLQAIQRFDVASKLGVIFTSALQISLATVAITTGNLTLMFLAQLIVGLISYFVGYYVVQKIFPVVKTKLIYDWTLIKKFYKYGISTFFVGFSNSLLTYFDRLIIPIFLGPKSLTYYTAPGTISTKIPGLANSIGSVIFSMSSSFQGSGDDRRQKMLYEKSSKVVLLLSISIAVGIIVFSKELLGHWIDFDIAENSYLILILLSITSVFLSIYNILQNTLLGTGRFKELAYTTITMLIINLTGLFILLPTIGLIGAAIAYLISVLPVVFLKLYVDKKYFDIPYVSKNKLIFYIKLILIIIVTILLMLETKTYATNIINVIVLFGISNIVFMLLSKVLNLITKEESDLAIKYFLKK